MISNSAKLDSRTKQHTQSGVCTSDGSRNIAATKGDKIVAEKRKRKKKKKRSELDGKQYWKIRQQDQAAHSIWSLYE